MNEILSDVSNTLQDALYKFTLPLNRLVFELFSIKVADKQRDRHTNMSTDN